MQWPIIILMALILFVNRYIFLAPSVPIKLPKFIQEALRYSAPCILTAICGPILLMDGETLRAFPANPYLWGAIFCVVVAAYVRNMIAAVLIGLTFFYLLIFLL
jgi:branched-subunit amino acid transport protein